MRIFDINLRYGIYKSLFSDNFLKIFISSNHTNLISHLKPLKNDFIKIKDNNLKITFKSHLKMLKY